MKIDPINRALEEYADEIQARIVHTGQHYDHNMSEIFFQQLGLPEPDVSLNVGSGTQAHQTARIMMAYEDLIREDPPDLVLVVGDVNSTMACALVAVKLHVPVGHVEAGLRSFDRTMPEEINRMVTDRVSDYLFTTCQDGVVNLIREGVDEIRIIEVGNPMIDTLVRLLPEAEQSPILEILELASREFMLVTLHRPANVDDPEHLEQLLRMLGRVSEEVPVIFPVHPRTRKTMEEQTAFKPADFPRLKLTEPMPYLDFLKLEKEAQLVLTDSGGIQEETSVLGVPCLTVRENTERPVTIVKGTNRLVGTDPGGIEQAVRDILAGDVPEATLIPQWDGHAGERIAKWIYENLVK